MSSIHWLYVTFLFILFNGLNNYLSKNFGLDLQISYLILFISLSIVALEFNKLRFLLRFKAFCYFIIFFLFYLFISFTVALSNGESADGLFLLRSLLPSLLVYVASSLVMFLLYIDLGDYKFLSLLRNLLLVNSLAICVGYVLNLDVFKYDGGRTGGFLLNANQAGYTANLLLVIQLYLIQKRQRFRDLFILGIVILSLFLSFSRAALFGSCFFLLYYVLSNYSLKKAIRSKNVIYLVVISAMSYFVYVTYIVDILKTNEERVARIELLIKGEFTDETSSNRTSLFKRAIESIGDDFLFGRGARSMSRLEGVELGVHNQFLLILGEGGILSLLFFLWILKLLWDSCNIMYRDEKWFVRGLLLSSFVFMMATHNMLNNKTLILIFPLTIVTIIYHNVCHIWSVR